MWLASTSGTPYAGALRSVDGSFPGNMRNELVVIVY
jgi:hypothetical protein